MLADRLWRGIVARRRAFRAGIAALALGPAALAEAGDVSREIEARLAAPRTPLWLADHPRPDDQWTALRLFYQQRDFAPAWLDESGPRPQAHELLAAAGEAARLGLDERRYQAAQGALAAYGFRPEWPTAVADQDLRLSDMFLRLSQDLLEGRIRPRGASAYWPASPAPEADASRLLAAGTGADGPRAVLASLVPDHPQYRALLRALEEHRAVAAAGGWPRVPSSPAPKPGRRDTRLGAAIRRVSASGDASVKAFQARHGLKPDGRLTDGTLAALNVPVEERIAQIELNLERWRWLPRTLGARYLMINVAAFELHAVQEGATERMKIAAGRAGESPTPIFDAEMSTVVFSPWWNVPPRIAEEEIAPAGRSAARKRGLKTVAVEDGVQYRQPPGPGNPMGLVKFLLPNPYNIYLHDTPEDALFARARRDFSHGCLRVERPVALARWALRDDPAWTEARIREAMRARKERSVELAAPVPVHVAYFSAWVEGDGTVRFLPDVYGHDQAQLALMRGEDPWQRVAPAGGAAASRP